VQGKNTDPGQTTGLNADQIHVWVINGGEYTRYDASILQRLQADEVSRARRYNREAHAAQWAFYHAALREILGAHTGQAPQEIEFQLGEHGKPALLEPGERPLFFNLSHAGALALLAVTRRAPIGVDIEPVRELKDREALVKRFFSAAEQSLFRMLAQELRSESFFNIWTRKEAVIKANGIGLSAPLDAFDVPISPFTGWRLPEVRPPLPAHRNFPLQHIDPGRGYVGAVALELADTRCSKLPSVELYHFQPGWDPFTRQTSP
jgi:4'-phosphopantetheinyl transferase